MKRRHEAEVAHSVSARLSELSQGPHTQLNCKVKYLKHRANLVATVKMRSVNIAFKQVNTELF